MSGLIDYAEINKGAPVGLLAPPSPQARAALQWGYRDALQECGDLLASLGLSIRESAYQGRDALAGAHLREARLVLIEAIRVFRELESLGGAA
jgi:hypothetical protein